MDLTTLATAMFFIWILYFSEPQMVIQRIVNQICIIDQPSNQLVRDYARNEVTMISTMDVYFTDPISSDH